MKHFTLLSLLLQLLFTASATLATEGLNWPTDTQALKANSTGNKCAAKPEYTLKVLEELENKALCKFGLTQSQCYKLFLATGAPGVSGRLAAKKAVGISKIAVDPEIDIICDSKFTQNNSITLPHTLKYESFLFILGNIDSAWAATVNPFCRLNPTARFRSELRDLVKSMDEEIQTERQEIFDKATGAKEKAENQIIKDNAEEAKKFIQDSKNQYLKSLEEFSKTDPVKKPEVLRIKAAIEKNIEESLRLDPTNYKAVYRQLTKSADWLAKQDIHVTVPGIEKSAKAFEDINKAKNLPTMSSANLTNDQKRAIEELKKIFDRPIANDSEVMAEFAKFKKQFPNTHIDDLSKAYIENTKKLGRLSIIKGAELNFQNQMLSTKTADQAEKLIAETIAKINSLGGVSNFKTAKVGIGLSNILSWAKNAKLKISEFGNISRAARGLTLTGALVAGKAALASTAVGTIPVALETAAQEAVERSVFYNQAECVANKVRNSPTLSQNKAALLGFDYVELNGTNCQPTVGWNDRFNKLFELNPTDRLKLAQLNDSLCSSIYQLYEKESLISKNDIQCLDAEGRFSISNKQKNGSLTTQQIVSPIGFDQLTFKNSNQIANNKSCSQFTVNLQGNTQNSSDTNCKTYQEHVADELYDYAMFTNYCKGTKGNFSDLVASKVQTGSSSLQSSPRNNSNRSK